MQLADLFKPRPARYPEPPVGAFCVVEIFLGKDARGRVEREERPLRRGDSIIVSPSRQEARAYAREHCSGAWKVLPFGSMLHRGLAD